VFPFRELEFLKFLVGVYTGIIDENVAPAELSSHQVRCVAYIIRRRNISRNAKKIPVDGANSGFSVRCIVQIYAGNVSSSLSEGQSDRLTDPATGSGDDRYPSIMCHTHSLDFTGNISI
jgi:hypothetical protein